MPAPAPTIKLANGVEIPALGLGTWPMDDAEAETVVAGAIRSGYRLIDTAEGYKNEVGVGKAVRASGVDRSEIFVTSKFNEKWHGYEGAQQAWAACAERLGLDYIDLLLIHWPVPKKDRYVDAWRGLIKLLEDGKVRAIGTSNFKPAHIERLIAETGMAPHLNQVQLNPRIPRQDHREFGSAHDIITETWAPIGKGRDLLAEAPVVALSQKHSKTPAQIVLRWHVQHGLVPIPKSSNPGRLAENLSIFDFELSQDEMRALDALDRHGEGAVDSDNFGH
jgi:2,5-diketo-D-gluconate reductase A